MPDVADAPVTPAIFKLPTEVVQRIALVSHLHRPWTTPRRRRFAWGGLRSTCHTLKAAADAPFILRLVKSPYCDPLSVACKAPNPLFLVRRPAPPPSALGG